MGLTLQCFSIEELEKLDPEQLKLLKYAIEREIGSNPDILKILQQKLRPTYTRMVAPAKGSAARGRTPKGGSD